LLCIACTNAAVVVRRDHGSEVIAGVSLAVVALKAALAANLDTRLRDFLDSMDDMNVRSRLGLQPRSVLWPSALAVLHVAQQCDHVSSRQATPSWPVTWTRPCNDHSAVHSAEASCWPGTFLQRPVKGFNSAAAQASVKLVAVMQEDVHTMRVIIERMQVRLHGAFRRQGWHGCSSSCSAHASSLKLHLRSLGLAACILSF
jgi:hypothetical protein